MKSKLAQLFTGFMICTAGAACGEAPTENNTVAESEDNLDGCGAHQEMKDTFELCEWKGRYSGRPEVNGLTASGTCIGTGYVDCTFEATWCNEWVLDRTYPAGTACVGKQTNCPDQPMDVLVRPKHEIRYTLTSGDTTCDVKNVAASVAAFCKTKLDGIYSSTNGWEPLIAPLIAACGATRASLGEVSPVTCCVDAPEPVPAPLPAPARSTRR